VKSVTKPGLRDNLAADLSQRRVLAGTFFFEEEMIPSHGPGGFYGS
jgi:hypothetical protein